MHQFLKFIFGIKLYMFRTVPLLIILILLTRCQQTCMTYTIGYWKEHIAKKRKQTDIKAKEINWLIGRHSNISLENKLLVYKAVIKPIWTYGIELWGCASKSNVAIIQRSQSKILRTIANSPWFVSNHTPHTDLNIPYASEVINERINKHHNKLKSHPNPPVQTLKQPMRNRRLKRRWTSDLQDWGDITGWSPYQDNIILTYLLTPWCRVLSEQLTDLQLVKKFPAFHGTRRCYYPSSPYQDNIIG